MTSSESKAVQEKEIVVAVVDSTDNTRAVTTQWSRESSIYKHATLISYIPGVST